MSNNRFQIRRAAYGPTFVMTFDEDRARPAADADISRKLDRIIDALEREIKSNAGRKSPKESLEEAIREVQNKYDYVDELRRQGVNLTPEAIRRDYDAENPHMRKDGKYGYETPEDRVTVPARLMQDSARRYRTVCEEAENAYADRNPHKSKRPTTRTARDSARRPMTICEQCEAAYAARNPHKRKEVR